MRNKFITTQLIMKKYFLLLSLLLSSIAYSQAQISADNSKYIEGKHYTVLDPVIDTNNRSQVVIYEFFSYKCPHCSTFQAFMDPWHKKQGPHVKLIRIPVEFQPGWDILAKAYFTAEALGIIDKTHKALFDAIHKQRKHFRKIEDLAQWYSDNFNIDKKKFLSTSKSFMIDSKLRQAKNLVLKMKIHSTPTLIVNGKYRPNVKVLEGYPAVLTLVDYFIEKEVHTMGLD